MKCAGGLAAGTVARPVIPVKGTGGWPFIPTASVVLPPDPITPVPVYPRPLRSTTREIRDLLSDMNAPDLVRAPPILRRLSSASPPRLIPGRPLQTARAEYIVDRWREIL